MTSNSGHNVEVGYFAQHQAEALNGDETVFDLIDKNATGDMRARVRTLLGAFLFSGDDVDKKIKVLSGGEKSRLALARLLLEPVNLLVMDEPTNHLDLRAKEVLKQALAEFEGTLVIVSHDRDFLRGLTGRVFEFGGGDIRPYLGDIYDYLEAVKLSNLRELERGREEARREARSEKNGPDSADGLSNKERYAARKEAEKEERRLFKSVQRLEKEIDKLERRSAEIEGKLKDPEFYKSLKPDDPIYVEYEELKRKLGVAMGDWESAGAQLDAARERREQLA